MQQGLREVIFEEGIPVVLAIDIDGEKHVLGMCEGATENATSCTQLLSDLQALGLRIERAVLAVLDGDVPPQNGSGPNLGRTPASWRSRCAFDLP